MKTQTHILSQQHVIDVLAFFVRSQGATTNEVAKACGYATHTVRGIVSRLRHAGFTVSKTRGTGARTGSWVYRVRVAS